MKKLNKMKSVTIIGSGFASLSAACYLAKAGHRVQVFEKNEQVGGRARVWKKDGFQFDMGPSWYWMPDVFEKFFNDFGAKVSDFYELEKLSPAYRVFFDDHTHVDVPDNLDGICEVFDQIEPGSGKALRAFIKEAEFNYNVSVNDLIYKPGKSPMELVTKDTVLNVGQFFSTIRKAVKKRFSNPKLIQILEFPVLFLGAKPEQTPAFYNFMNYADFALGTWYPKGGMTKIVEAMHTLATRLGVEFTTNANVEKINVENGKATSITVNGNPVKVDVLLSGADYHHTESLLQSEHKMYSEKYWDSRIFAPSALLFYVAFNKKLSEMQHHMLFFDRSFDEHAKDIYDHPKWPKEPLFYANFSSISDESIAPEGCETGFFLIPVAPGLKDDDATREAYFEKIINRLEDQTGAKVRDAIRFKRSYCVSDFVEDYNAYKGNAYGMANILKQTAFLRPKIKSNKVSNLYFTGQLTVPGPGVPPALVSGKVAALEILSKTEKIEAA